jgi:hypothetical protein
LARSELAFLAYDEFGVAVDSQAADGPRLGRYKIVDHESYLRVPSPHIAELPALHRVHAADVEVVSVELVSHRRHVRLAVRRNSGDPGQPLGPQVGDLFLGEGHGRFPDRLFIAHTVRAINYIHYVR